MINKQTQPKSRSYVPVMDGFCPVTMMTESKWVRGDKDWGCFHRGKLFLFVSETNRDKFMKAPEKYCPALAGMDPVVYEQQGKLVDGGISSGLFVELEKRKMMVLFTNDQSKAEFMKDKSRYIKTIERLESSRSKLRTASGNRESDIR